MGLKTENWIPETYLRLINLGGGTIEAYTVTNIDEEKKGIKQTIAPHSEILIKVKDFLPPGINEPWKLTDGQLTFNLLNINEEESSFNIIAEGPFLKLLINPEYASDMHRIVAEYNSALAEKDYYTMRLMVKKPIPKSQKKNPQLYAFMCHGRAKMFSHLSQLDKAAESFEMGWDYCPDKQRWNYCFDWADVLMDKITEVESSDQIGKAIQKAISILDLAKKWSSGMSIEKYNIIASKGMIAFSLCYLGELDEARSAFNDIDFSPIPPDDFDEPDMAIFFNQVNYAFAAAIEMRDVGLVRNLSRIISTGRPDLLEEPSVQYCMRRAFGNVYERGLNNINAAFTGLINNRIKYAPELPNLAEFLSLLAVGDELGMNRYFGYVE